MEKSMFIVWAMRFGIAIPAKDIRDILALDFGQNKLLCEAEYMLPWQLTEIK